MCANDRIFRTVVKHRWSHPIKGLVHKFHMTQLRCSRCGLHKPPEHFPYNKTIPRGRGYYCRPCERVRRQERALSPKRKVLYHSDPVRRQRMIASAAKWQKANPKKALEYSRRWRAKHRPASTIIDGGEF
jgi:hypothetical protein